MGLYNQRDGKTAGMIVGNWRRVEREELKSGEALTRIRSSSLSSVLQDTMTWGFYIKERRNLLRTLLMVGCCCWFGREEV